jgi:hypothetical protein
VQTRRGWRWLAPDHPGAPSHAASRGLEGAPVPACNGRVLSANQLGPKQLHAGARAQGAAVGWPATREWTAPGGGVRIEALREAAPRSRVRVTDTARWAPLRLAARPSLFTLQLVCGGCLQL